METKAVILHRNFAKTFNFSHTIMKKSFLFLGLFVAMAITVSPVYAWEPNDSIVRLFFEQPIIDPIKDNPRMPIHPLTIGQAGHTLHFPELGDFVLNLYSEDEVGNLTLEYTETILASTSSTQLPSDLSGMYVIEIVCHGQRFRGEIEL